MPTLGEISNYFQTTQSFTSFIPFNRGLTYMSTTLTSSIVFVPNSTGSLPLANCLVTAVGDGSHSPTFSGFNKLSTSGVYSTGSSILNLIRFFYDGFGYYYEIANAGTIIASDPIVNMANLLRYYDAATSNLTLSGSNVLSITDLSPLNITATGSGTYPQYNAGKGGIDFNNGSNFNLTSVAPGSAFSLAFVIEHNNLAVPLGIFLEGGSNYYIISGSAMIMNIDSAHAETLPLTMSWATNEKAVFVVTANNSNIVTVYKNSGSVGSYTSSANFASAASNIIRWGADSGVRIPDGTMYSLILANRVFTNTEISTITSTMKVRYSIP